MSMATGKHTVFGRISEGMKVIQRMGLVPTGASDRYERAPLKTMRAPTNPLYGSRLRCCRPRDEIRIRRAYPETK